MEIERKFLPKEVPDLTNYIPISYERYYLEQRPGFEKRIQKKGDIFELEELIEENSLSRSKSKKILSSEEFEELRKNTKKSLIRESYILSHNPEISIKIYHGDYEGLTRVEVEFGSVEEAKLFKPLDWFGQEITDSPLGRDSQLIDLSEMDFKRLLDSYQR